MVGEAMLESQREAGVVVGELSGNVVVAVAPVEPRDSSASDKGRSFLKQLGEVGRSKEMVEKEFAFDLVLVA